MQTGMLLSGHQSLVTQLNSLPVRIQKNVTRSAIRAAMRPVVNRAKQIARARKKAGGFKESREEKKQRRTEDLYHLSETIGVVVRTYPASGTILAVAGPIAGSRYGYKGNIGHLVEAGHAKVLWGRVTGEQVPPYPFLAPAWDEQLGAVKQVLNTTMAAGIEREARKIM
ncbi:MAG TPA: hypothetical protein VMY37_24380 [Thermoguttaceae bacterium]|nr:hypothetical protein [Thermoguttaceae bacterium]